jgi:hypothetical protein
LDKVQVIGKDVHAHFPSIDDPLNRPIFCFVRHPVAWYLSRFAFRLQKGWVGGHPLDAKCASNNFEHFIDNVCKEYPDGWLIKEYKMFIDSAPRAPKIGRVENLQEDLYDILRGFKYRVSKKKMSKLGLINNSNFGDLRPREVIKISAATEQKIIKLEHKVIDRFYENHDCLPIQ